MTLTPGQPSGPAVAQPLFGMSASERPPTGVFGTYLATGRWSDTSELHVIEPLRPSYQGMARVAPTRPIDESEKRIPQVMEKVAAAVAWLMVIITAAVWWRANAGVQDCKGGCDDLAAVVNGLSGSGTAVVILSLIAMVAAAFSLRKTHSTDATRALGALALIAAVITMILGIVLFNVTLP
jgi:hypothetical protein